MATADVEIAAPASRPYQPWLARRIDASALPLALAGLGIALVQLASFFGWIALGWALGVGSPRDRWFWQQMVGPNVIMAALIGWVPAAMVRSRRRAAVELDALAPWLGAEAARARERLAAFPRWPLACAGAAVGALVLPIVRFDPDMRAAFEQTHGFGRAWMLWVNFLVGWLLVRALLEDLRIAAIFQDAGERIERLDLFELAPLEPFARRAAEGVLLGAVSAALLFLIFAGEGWASTTLPLLLAAILAFPLFALVLPLLGVHRRIRAEKQRELARIHAAARAERDALLAGGAAPRLPALLALRSHVAEQREWPVDLSTLLRILAYLGIGLGSWIGAALVDASIESLLR
jgi:hypothetical protein